VLFNNYPAAGPLASRRLARPGGRWYRPCVRGQFLTSDGVPLGYLRQGREPGGGPPRILVHGGATDTSCFEPLLPRLSAARDVLCYDRRGRAGSGDGSSYDVRREVLDLAEFAAFAAGGGPADVFGHSYGGTIALLLAADRGLSGSIGKLAVYEPPFAVPGLVPAGLPAKVRELADAGRADEALRAFLGHVLALPDRVLAVMRHHPSWAASLAALPTLHREFDVVTSVPPPDRIDPAIDVLYLIGKAGGNPSFGVVAAAVRAASPRVTMAEVGGLPHLAIATWTEPMAALLDAYFGGPDLAGPDLQGRAPGSVDFSA